LTLQLSGLCELCGLARENFDNGLFFYLAFFGFPETGGVPEFLVYYFVRTA
jgi:hypothetical protein